MVARHVTRVEKLLSDLLDVWRGLLGVFFMRALDLADRTGGGRTKTHW